MITLKQLQQMLPKASTGWLEPLNAAMQEWHIADSPLRIAAFLAQAAVESRELNSLEENFNYSAAALAKVPGWATKFPPAVAERIGRTAAHPADQQAIANIAYAGRFGNGGPESGDGWRYRGGGIFQLTFHDNYRDCGISLSLDLVKHPELVRTDKLVAARSAGWFWYSKGLSVLADQQQFELLTAKINRAKLGLKERTEYWVRNLKVLT